VAGKSPARNQAVRFSLRSSADRRSDSLHLRSPSGGFAISSRHAIIQQADRALHHLITASSTGCFAHWARQDDLAAAPRAPACSCRNSPATFFIAFCHSTQILILRRCQIGGCSAAMEQFRVVDLSRQVCQAGDFAFQAKRTHWCFLARFGFSARSKRWRAIAQRRRSHDELMSVRRSLIELAACTLFTVMRLADGFDRAAL